MPFNYCTCCGAFRSALTRAAVVGIEGAQTDEMLCPTCLRLWKNAQYAERCRCLEAVERDELREKIAWRMHEVATIGDDDAAASFDDMSGLWFNILMEAAGEVLDAVRQAIGD